MLIPIVAASLALMAFALTAVAAAKASRRSHGYSYYSADSEPGVTTVIAAPLFTFVMIFFPGIAIANAATDHRDSFRTFEVVALRDGTGQSGGYVLGTGSNDTTGRFMFYRRDGDAVRLENVDADGIRLFEDTDRPYVVQFTGCHLKPDWLAPCFSDAPVFTELHVPKGSVRNKIDLSLNSH